MDRRLNFFSPYERAPAGHENQLTRALMVVLRYSPMSHQVWMRMVAPQWCLHELPKPVFATQRQRLLPDDAVIQEGEVIQGISVCLTPDLISFDEDVRASDRVQILDGIISYGSDLLVVIENKIVSGAITQQPSLINHHGLPVVFSARPQCISWRQLLTAFADLVERELVCGAERLIVTDFLDLVEEHFPRIGPHSTLDRCGANTYRLNTRLDAIQDAALLTDQGKGLGWRDIAGSRRIFMAWLGLADEAGEEVCLAMYPADTLGQSRDLYGDPSAVQAVIGLRDDHWRIQANFHWGFMAGGYAWMRSPMTLDEYCAYWIQQIGSTRELQRAEWDDYWSRLVADGIVMPDEREKFDAEFTRSQRQKAHPRPGLFCEYRWSLAEAKRLDARGAFVGAVRERVNQMLDALRAPRIAAD